MKKTKIIKITRVFLKLSFTAILADLLYIIYRMGQPALTLDDASFLHAVPEMLRHILLCVVIVAAFMAAMIYILKNESQ